MFPDLSQFILFIPPLLFALTVHEFAHAWAADKLGDSTARLLGRLTLNPIVHLDPIGAILLLLVHFGWAKPIPVDPRNLKNPRRDMMWIALAGPVSNVILAALSGFAIQWIGLFPSDGMMGMFQQMLIGSLYLNLGLAFFNLIPLPPLDGSRILTGLLPPRQAYQYSQLEQYGPGVLMMVIIGDRMLNLGIISTLIMPPIGFCRDLFLGF